MAYSDDIDALSPDHRWAFNGSSGTDSVGSATATMTGTVSAAAISEDVSNSAQTNAIAGDRMSLGSITTIGNSAHSRKAIGGWFQISKVDAHPVRIYGEGDADPTFQFVMAMGNNLMLETVDGGTSVQVYGLALAVDRPYYIYGELQGDGYNDTLRLYVDGVLQESIAFGSTTLATRGLAEFADPAGTVGVGGDTVLLQAPVNGSYNQWASWANKTLPTATEIREELFEKGAVPTTTITNQAGLDALADTVRGDTPLSILVNVVGDISLSADNVTFNPLCSIHVQYNGTGTLTWTNTNGSNASIGSTTSTGTIAFVNPATLTINGVINGAEVRLYDDDAPSGPSVLHTDTFTNTNGTALSTHDSGWTLDVGTAADIQSNGVQGNAAGATVYRWTDDTPNDDQYISMVWDGDNSNGSILSGLLVRLDASGNGYILYSNGATAYLARVDAYSATAIDSQTISFAATDVIELSIEGTTITTTKNGSATGMPSGTDSNHSSGNAGLYFTGDGANARMASVTIGNNQGGATQSFGTELDGIENNSGTSFVFSHSGATNDILIQMMADGYEEVIENFSLIASDQVLTLFPKVETN